MSGQLKIIAILLSSFILTGCPEKENNNSGEIVNTSDDFELYYSNSGGMSPESEHIYISNDSASWKYGRYKKESLITWTPRSEDISNLIEFLKKNNYLKIESREEQEVYDRGGVRITIIHSGNKKELDNSGRTFVKDQWSENFRAIKDYVKNYVKTEVDKQLITVPFIADTSLSMNSEPVKMWLNDRLFYSSVEDNLKPIEQITVYPGLNTYSWTIYYSDSVNYNNDPIYQFGGQDVFNTTEDTKEIILQRENQEILLNVR